MTSPRVAAVVLAGGASARMDAGFKLLLPFGDGVVVEAPVRAALEAGLEPVVVVTGYRGQDVRRALEACFGAVGPDSSGGASRDPEADTVSPTAGDRDARATGRGGAATGEDDAGEATSPSPTGLRGLVRVVGNPRYAEGQATSVARGIRAVRADTGADAAAVLMGDEPGIEAEAIRKVVEAWRDSWRGTSASASPPARRSAPPGEASKASPGAAPAPPILRARYRDRPGHPVIFPRDVFGEIEAIEGDRGARGWLERNAGRVEEVRLDGPAPVDVDTDEDYREATGRTDLDSTGAP